MAIRLFLHRRIEKLSSFFLSCREDSIFPCLRKESSFEKREADSLPYKDPMGIDGKQSVYRFSSVVLKSRRGRYNLPDRKSQNHSFGLLSPLGFHIFYKKYGIFIPILRNIPPLFNRKKEKLSQK